MILNGLSLSSKLEGIIIANLNVKNLWQFLSKWSRKVSNWTISTYKPLTLIFPDILFCFFYHHSDVLAIRFSPDKTSRVAQCNGGRICLHFEGEPERRSLFETLWLNTSEWLVKCYDTHSHALPKRHETKGVKWVEPFGLHSLGMLAVFKNNIPWKTVANHLYWSSEYAAVKQVRSISEGVSIEVGGVSATEELVVIENDDIIVPTSHSHLMP